MSPCRRSSEQIAKPDRPVNRFHGTTILHFFLAPCCRPRSIVPSLGGTMNTAEGFCGYRIQRNHYERPLASDVYFVIGMDEELAENSDYL